MTGTCRPPGAVCTQASRKTPTQCPRWNPDIRSLIKRWIRSVCPSLLFTIATGREQMHPQPVQQRSWSYFTWLFQRAERQGNVYRVLSRIYRLGRGLKWPKITSFLGGVRGHTPPEIFFKMNMRWDVSLRSRRLDRLSKKSFVGFHIIGRFAGQKRPAPFTKRLTCSKSSAWIVVDTRKNGRARRRHACLPRARPFSLFPTTSKRLLRRLLRCSLVHFQTQFCEMLRIVHWPRRVWMIFPIYLIIYCNDNNIIWGGGEAGHFEGEASSPQIP